jgi:hypothetical protein
VQPNRYTPANFSAAHAAVTVQLGAHYPQDERRRIQNRGERDMYYPDPLIARRMRQFQILRQRWRRYLAATDPAGKAFAERQYPEG